MDLKPQIPAKPVNPPVSPALANGGAPAVSPQASSGSTPASQPTGSLQPGSSTQAKIIFYCKDCRKVVEGSKVGNKYVYKCPVCHSKNVAFGTEKSIKSFYHVAAA